MITDADLALPDGARRRVPCCPDVGRPGRCGAGYFEDLTRFPENGWSLYGLTERLHAQDNTEAAEVE